MTCNNIFLSQPKNGEVLVNEIPKDASARLNFGPDDIAGLQMADDGALIISFVNGGELKISNFQEVVENGNLLFLSDNTLVDASILTSALKSPAEFNKIEAASGEDTGITYIGQPAANTTQEISMEQGQKYVCDFDPANAATVELKDGQMVLTFADGSQVVINNYSQAMAGNLPAELTVQDGTVVDAEQLITQVTEVAAPVEEILQFTQVEAQPEIEVALPTTQQVSNIAEQVANVEPAAGVDDITQTLAQIEPAAGETGAVSNSGYGFNSSPIDVPLNSPLAIGPLGPTQLPYQAPQFTHEQYVPQLVSSSNSTPRLSASNLSLDETNLTAGNLVGTGTVNVNFGADGPGSIVPNGTFSATCEVANNVLTSGGVLVDVTTTPDGYVGVANGVTVFTFVIDSETGEYVYTQFETFDHADTSDTNEPICLDFGILATDGDGDRVTTTVRVNVLDDAPIVGDDTNTIDEDNLSAGPIVVNDSVSVDFGNDGQGALKPNGTFTSGGSLDNGILSSNGVAVVVTQTANGYVGVANGVTVFTLEIDPTNGNYTFTQFEALDHADDTDPNDIITLNFGTVITDYDGDSDGGTITINIVDSAPTFQPNGPTPDHGVETVDETDGPIVETGTLEADFGGDGPGTYVADGEFTPSGSLANGALTSCGHAVVVTFDEATNTYTGSANGETVFTLEINPETGKYTYSQVGALDHADPNDPNDIITLTFGVDAVDREGEAAKGSIVINVKDDAPRADNVAAGSVDETDGETKILSGTIPDADFGRDGAGSVVANGQFNSSGSQTAGQLTSAGQPVTVNFDVATGTYTGVAGGSTIFTMALDDDGNYNFELLGVLDHADGSDDNDIINLNFGYRAEDCDGDHANAFVSVRVDDDAPTAAYNVISITSDADLENGPNVATGRLDFDFGEDGAGTVEPSGEFKTKFVIGGPLETLTSGGEIVNVTKTANGYIGTVGGETAFTMEIDSTTGDYTFTQFKPVDHPETGTKSGDEVIWLVFGVTITDADGDSVNQYINVDIGDSDPEAVDDTNTAQEGTTVTGSVLDNDDIGADVDGSVCEVQFNGQSYTVPATGSVNVTGQYGVLTISADGSYSYVANNNNPNGVDRFTYVMKDFDGDTSTANLDITVTSVNDVPTIEASFTPVNETDLCNHPLVVNKTLVHDFGDDGAGSITVNGTTETKFEVGGQNQTLTSGGREVVISTTANNGYVGVANGQTIFTLTLDSQTGEYTYTQFAAVDHPGDGDDVIWLKLGVTITDSDGDAAQSYVVVDIRDGVPEANDDKIVVEEGDQGAGNVLDNDHNCTDGEAVVTIVTFEGQDYTVPENGSVTVQGDQGTLVMNSDGSYTYEATGGNETQTVRSFEISNPAGSDDAGVIQNVSGSLNETTSELTFSFTMEGSNTDGATLVLNDGPNPKGVAGQLAQFYIDNTGAEPVVSVYGYNGLGGVPGTSSSAFDGSEADGIQAPDQIFSSLNAGSPFTNISVTTDANGNQTFTFSIDTAALNAHIPLYGDAASWEGVDFSDMVGAWFHPVSGLTTDYDANGFLTQYDFTDRSGWDSNNTPTNTSTISGEDHFTYTIRDADGDTSTANLDVCVEDDPKPTGIYGENTTDDTNVNANGSDVVTGEIAVNYNGDDAGFTSGTGTFSPVNNVNLPNGKLSHNGVEIDVRFDVNTNTYVGTAGNLTVFTMVIHEDATYTFSQLESIDHGNTSARNEQIMLQFGVKATDSDGDEGVGQIQIRVRDDWSDARNDTASTDDGETVTGNVVDNDVLGADETSLVTNVVFDGVDYAVNAGSTTRIETPKGVLTIDQSGEYSYAAKDGSEGVDRFRYTLTDGDGDTNTAQLAITVENVNDVPTITTSVAPVNESDLCDHPLVVNKTLVHDFGDDGAGSITVNGTTEVKFKVGGQNQTLTSNGEPVIISTTNNNGYVGTVNGQTIFTLDLNAQTGEYTYTQFAAVDHPGIDKAGTNDVIWLKLGVTITDSDGDTADAYVNIDIRDAAPTANDDKAVLEKGMKIVTQSLDLDASDVAGTQTSYSHDGITIVSENGHDLTWVNHAGGSGVGVEGNGTDKAFGKEEPVDVRFSNDVNSASITLGDIGANNIGDWFKYEVTLSDGSVVKEVIRISGNDVVGETFNFHVSGYGSDISSIKLIGGPSYLLNNVETSTRMMALDDAKGNVLDNDHACAEDATVTSVSFNGKSYDIAETGNTVIRGDNGRLIINASGKYTYKATGNGGEDQFIYTITDTDGDTSTATLDVCVEVPNCDVEANNDYFTVYDVSAASWDANRGDTVLTNPNFVAEGWTNAHKETYNLTNGVTVHEDTDVWTFGWWYDLPVLQNDDAGLTITNVEFLSQDNPNQEVKIAADGKSLLLHVAPDFGAGDNPNFQYDVSKLRYTVIDEHGCETTAEVTVSSWDATSPLILDLNGNGVELLPIENGVNFDMDNDGQVEKTGWVGADDGLLALDKNGDGVINNQSELFGNNDSASDGFANLAEYDGNADGVINAEDAIYHDLQVWQDANSDGVSDENEMLSLADLEIVSISLNAETPDDLVIEGSWISHISSYQMADGQTREVVDAWFNVEEIESVDYFATAEADNFLFEAIADSAVGIHDFSALQEGLDLSTLLEEGQDDLADTINNFVYSTQKNGDTIISADLGNAGETDPRVIAELEGVAGQSLEDLVENGNIVV